MKKRTFTEELSKSLKKNIKDLLAEVKDAENTEIKGKNVAFGDKQQTLDVEDRWQLKTRVKIL